MQPAIGEIEPRLGHARQAPHRAFDAPDAAAAGDALDRQIHAERAVGTRLGIEREVERLSHFKFSLRRHTLRSFPRKRESSAANSSIAALGPRLRGDERRMFHRSVTRLCERNSRWLPR